MKRHKQHTKLINIRIPDGLYELLIEMASIKEETLSGMVRELLVERATTYRSHRDAE